MSEVSGSAAEHSIGGCTTASAAVARAEGPNINSLTESSLTKSSEDGGNEEHYH